MTFVQVKYSSRLSISSAIILNLPHSSRRTFSLTHSPLHSLEARVALRDLHLVQEFGLGPTYGRLVCHRDLNETEIPDALQMAVDNFPRKPFMCNVADLDFEAGILARVFVIAVN